MSINKKNKNINTNILDLKNIIRQTHATSPSELANYLGNKDMLELLKSNKSNSRYIIFDKIEYGSTSDIKELINMDSSLVTLSDNEGYTPIMHAATYDKFQLISELIKYGANIDQKDNSGNTALTYAILNDSVNSVEVLLDHKANCEVENNDGLTPLMNAIVHNNKNILNIFSYLSINFNYSNTLGITPLMLAVSESNYDCVKMLFKKHVDMNKTDKNGFNALMYAVANSDYKMVKLLTNKNIYLEHNINKKVNQNSVIGISNQKNDKSLSNPDEYSPLNSNVDLKNIFDGDGAYSPLFSKINTDVNEETINKSHQVVENSNYNVLNKYNNVYSHQKSFDNNKINDELLNEKIINKKNSLFEDEKSNINTMKNISDEEENFNLNSVSVDLKEILSVSSLNAETATENNRDYDSVGLIDKEDKINEEEDINNIDNLNVDLSSVLEITSEENIGDKIIDINDIQALSNNNKNYDNNVLDNKEQEDSIEEKNITLLHSIVDNITSEENDNSDSKFTVDDLINKIIKNESFDFSVFEKIEDINEKNEYGYNLLLTVCKYSKIDIANEILKFNPDMNVVYDYSQDSPDYGFSCILYAITTNNLEMLSLLLKAGASPNIGKSGGWPPLSFAIAQKQYDVVELLVRYKASKSLKSDHGYTVLDVANKLNDNKILKIIT